MGSTLYLAGFEKGERLSQDQVHPCLICRRMIKNAGIDRVITIGDVEHFSVL